MPGLADTRRGILDLIAAGLPDVLVVGDPRQAVPPCVFVDLITINGTLTDCSLTGEILIWVLASPDPDAIGAAQMDALADQILALDLMGPPTTAGRLLILPGGVEVPGYTLTLPVTVETISAEPAPTTREAVAT